MYLLDTDVLSNLARRRPPPTLVSKLATVPVEQQFTSSITLGELVYGARLLGARGETLLAHLERTLLPGRPLLPFDAEAAYRYGALRAELERSGTPIGDADLRIASIALSRELVMVTGNVRHFGRVPGLQVENWLN